MSSHLISVWTPLTPLPPPPFSCLVSLSPLHTHTHAHMHARTHRVSHVVRRRRKGGGGVGEGRACLCVVSPITVGNWLEDRERVETCLSFRESVCAVSQRGGVYCVGMWSRCLLSSGLRVSFHLVSVSPSSGLRVSFIWSPCLLHLVSVSPSSGLAVSGEVCFKLLMRLENKAKQTNERQRVGVVWCVLVGWLVGWREADDGKLLLLDWRGKCIAFDSCFGCWGSGEVCLSVSVSLSLSLSLSLARSLASCI